MIAGVALEERGRAALGLLVLVFLAWLLSKKRRLFPWRVVLWGVGLQVALGLVFLWWTAGRETLQEISRGVKDFLDLSLQGSVFVFGGLGDPANAGFKPYGFVMAFMVLPTIIFFSSFMAVLYHMGIMQAVVKAFAWVMAKTMGTSGGETLSAAANIFVGQTEAPLLVQPFVEKMTESELMAVMTGGFATIAGGVFAMYVGFGVPAGHLLVASVMSAPAALVMAKVMVPETEESVTKGTLKAAVPRTSANVVEAAANGALMGLQLALNVGAMLIAFLGILAVLNAGLGWVGREAGVQLSLERVLGWVFSPFAAMMGVPWGEVPKVGGLLGTKIAANELVAYGRLTEPAFRHALSERSFLIATYALCGFANFGSIGIQLGGIGGIAPSRKSDLARLGLRAMLAGAFASWMTACLAGVML